MIRFHVGPIYSFDDWDKRNPSRDDDIDIVNSPKYDRSKIETKLSDKERKSIGHSEPYRQYNIIIYDQRTGAKRTLLFSKSKEIADRMLKYYKNVPDFKDQKIEIEINSDKEKDPEN